MKAKVALALAACLTIGVQGMFPAPASAASVNVTVSSLEGIFS